MGQPRLIIQTITNTQRSDIDNAVSLLLKIKGKDAAILRITDDASLYAEIPELARQHSVDLALHSTDADLALLAMRKLPQFVAFIERE